MVTDPSLAGSQALDAPHDLPQGHVYGRVAGGELDELDLGDLRKPPGSRSTTTSSRRAPQRPERQPTRPSNRGTAVETPGTPAATSRLRTPVSRRNGIRHPHQPHRCIEAKMSAYVVALPTAVDPDSHDSAAPDRSLDVECCRDRRVNRCSSRTRGWCSFTSLWHWVWPRGCPASARPIRWDFKQSYDGGGLAPCTPTTAKSVVISSTYRTIGLDCPSLSIAPRRSVCTPKSSLHAQDTILILVHLRIRLSLGAKSAVTSLTGRYSGA